MPTIAERLEQIELKVKRAKEHIADLQGEITRFLNTEPKPYAGVLKRDSQTGEVVCYITRVDATPKCLPLIAGDAIQNLMGALDHLAFQIVCSDTGDSPPRPNKIYFPIANSAVEYDEAFKPRKIQGASQASIDAIDALEPYKGGKGNALWVLQALNNIEKHRLLLLVGANTCSINLGKLLTADAGRLHEKAFGERPPTVDVFFKPSDVKFPLEVGKEIFRTSIQMEPDEKLEFRFEVALYQPQVIEAQSILETLRQFAAFVEGIVVALTPRLRDTTI